MDQLLPSFLVLLQLFGGQPAQFLIRGLITEQLPRFGDLPLQALQFTVKLEQLAQLGIALR